MSDHPQAGDAYMFGPGEAPDVGFILGLGLVSGIIGSKTSDKTRAVLALHLRVLDPETEQEKEYTFAFPHEHADYDQVIESLQAMIDKIRVL